MAKDTTSLSQLSHPVSVETSTPLPHNWQTSSAGSDSDEIALADIVHFFHRHLWFIGGSALVAGVCTGLFTLLLVPRTYGAAATLVIVPPQVSTELTPPTLTVQGYQRILESDAVLVETNQHLVEEGVLEEGSVLRLGGGAGEVETRIFVSREAAATPLAPMLEAVAHNKTPEQAASVANTWTKVFLQRIRTLMQGSTSAAVQFIDAQYPPARERIGQLEKTLDTVAGEFQKREDDLTTYWDEKTRAYDYETANLTATYETETQHLIADFHATHNLETHSGQLASLREVHSNLQSQQAHINAALQQKKLHLGVVRQQLEKTPQYLTLHKAMTDNALWEALAQAGGKDLDWESLRHKSLVSQEVNSLYTELSSRASETELEVNGLIPRSEQLINELERLSAEIKERDASIRRDNIALSQLERERQVGLEKLRTERGQQANILMRQTIQEMNALERERDQRLEQLRRDLVNQNELYTELAKNYNQAILVKAQQDVEDVRIGVPAVAVNDPEPRGTVMKSLIALVCGGLVGVCIAAVRDVAPSTNDEV